jgi:hypothetical protein
MKSLTNYIEDSQTALFKEMGVFFAFSNQQFDEQKKENVKYISMGAGTICPQENVKEFIKKHSDIVKNGIAQDIKENGIEAIIKRELGNYECFYTGDITDCVDALKDYDIKKETILQVFNGRGI